MFWNQIDRMTQEFGQCFGEWQALTEQVVTPWKIHQEVHVAVRTFHAPRHGSKNTLNSQNNRNA